MCHCEVAPVCAVIVADRGRERANYSSGEKWGEVLMSRIFVTELKSTSKETKQTPTKAGQQTDGAHRDRAPPIKTGAALVY